MKHLFNWKYWHFFLFLRKITIFDLITALCALVFQKLSENWVKYTSTYTKGTLKKRSAKDLLNDAHAMFLCFYSDFLFKTLCCGYTLVDAIQMGTHNICLYKEVDKKYTGWNLKNMELLDCVLIGVCAVIRSNTVDVVGSHLKYLAHVVNPQYVFMEIQEKIFICLPFLSGAM